MKRPALVSLPLFIFCASARDGTALWLQYCVSSGDLSSSLTLIPFHVWLTVYNKGCCAAVLILTLGFKKFSIKHGISQRPMMY